MGSIVEVDMPGGKTYIEVTPSDDSDPDRGLNLKDFSFEEVLNSMKKNAEAVLSSFNKLAPDGIELTVGLKLTAKGGANIWVIAEASAEANFSVKLTWKKDKS